MKKILLYTISFLVAHSASAQLIVAHLPYHVTWDYLDVGDVPYYYRGTESGDHVIMLNLDTKTIIIPADISSPNEQPLSSLKYESDKSMYICKADNPAYEKWRTYYIHINDLLKEPDYVFVQSVSKNRNLKKDTSFHLFTADLSTVHITERYSIANTMNSFIDTRAGYTFSSIYDESNNVRADNIIEINNKKLTWRSKVISGGYSITETDIDRAEIISTSTSNGLMFFCHEPGNDAVKYEFFYGIYENMGGGSYKKDAMMMYVRVVKNGVPVGITAFR